jgi:hypothetical protein
LGPETLGLLQHAFIPDQDRLLARLVELVDAGGGLLKEEVGDQRGVPLGRAEQVGKPLGAGGSVRRTQERGPQFREEQAMGAVSELEEHLDGGAEGADQTSIDRLVQGAEQRFEKELEPLAEIGGDLWARVAIGEFRGIIFMHRKETSGSVDGCASYIYPTRRSRFTSLSNSGMTHATAGCPVGHPAVVAYGDSIRLSIPILQATMPCDRPGPRAMAMWRWWPC